MRYFLPSLHGESEPEGQESPCGLTPQAQDFAEWWLFYLETRARLMICDPRLVKAAQAHAQWLSQNPPGPGVTMHIGAGGSTANQRAREAGYQVPGWQLDGNTGESATKSYDPMPELVADMMASPDHHDHLWGLDWYQEAVYYGIGASPPFYIVMVYYPEEI